jgi:hypothetical protein
MTPEMWIRFKTFPSIYARPTPKPDKLFQIIFGERDDFARWD